MPVVTPSLMVNDRLVDINSRLNGVNVGTTVIFSRFDIFSCPAFFNKNRSKRYSVINIPPQDITDGYRQDLSMKHPNKMDPRIIVIPSRQTNISTSEKPFKHSSEPKACAERMQKRPLLVTHNFRLTKALPDVTFQGIVVKPPVDRRQIKVARLKRDTCASLLGLSESTNGQSVRLAASLDEGDHIDEDIGAISSDEKQRRRGSYDSARLPIPRRTMVTIRHILSSVCGENYDGPIDVEIVNPETVCSELNFEICRPLDVLDFTFSERLGGALNLMAGFSPTSSKNIISVFRITNDIPLGGSPSSPAHLDSTSLTGSSLHIILTQRSMAHYWTLWELRKYIPPPKAMGEAIQSREVGWDATDCTFDGVEIPRPIGDGEAIYPGDCLSDDSDGLIS